MGQFLDEVKDAALPSGASADGVKEAMVDLKQQFPDRIEMRSIQSGDAGKQDLKSLAFFLASKTDPQPSTSGRTTSQNVVVRGKRSDKLRYELETLMEKEQSSLVKSAALQKIHKVLNRALTKKDSSELLSLLEHLQLVSQGSLMSLSDFGQRLFEDGTDRNQNRLLTLWEACGGRITLSSCWAQIWQQMVEDKGISKSTKTLVSQDLSSDAPSKDDPLEGFQHLIQEAQAWCQSFVVVSSWSLKSFW